VIAEDEVSQSPERRDGDKDDDEDVFAEHGRNVLVGKEHQDE
jgi:hypothetical protein